MFAMEFVRVRAGLKRETSGPARPLTPHPVLRLQRTVPRDMQPIGTHATTMPPLRAWTVLGHEAQSVSLNVVGLRI